MLYPLSYGGYTMRSMPRSASARCYRIRLAPLAALQVTPARSTPMMPAAWEGRGCYLRATGRIEDVTGAASYRYIRRGKRRSAS